MQSSEEPYKMCHRPLYLETEGRHSSASPSSHWSDILTKLWLPYHSKLSKHELQVGSPGHPMTQLQRSRSRKQEARDASLQPSLARLPLHRIGWSLQITGGHSCGWHKRRSEKTWSEVQEGFSTWCVSHCRGSINICSPKRPQVTGSQNWRMPWK